MSGPPCSAFYTILLTFQQLRIWVIQTSSLRTFWGVNLQHTHCFQLLICLPDSESTGTFCFFWGSGYCKQSVSIPRALGEKVMCCKTTLYTAWQYWLCTGCKMASPQSSEWKITETFNLTVLRHCVSEYFTGEVNTCIYLDKRGHSIKI